VMKATDMPDLNAVSLINYRLSARVGGASIKVAR
jgi:hypothetical protein